MPVQRQPGAVNGIQHGTEPGDTMLTVKAVEAAKPKDKSYKLADGGGLYRFITPGGIKSWWANFVRNGKQGTKTYGKRPELNLPETRKAHASDEGMSFVRGLAAVVVVVAHAIQIFIARIIGADSLVVQISGQMARQAVLVFFIVSGYLITHSILKNIQRNAGNFDPIEYATARIARIYPPLLFSLTLCLVLHFVMRLAGLPGGEYLGASPLGLPGDLYTARPWFAISLEDAQNVILMKNGMPEVNGPLWSLCIEWRVYIVAAFFALALTSRHWPSRVVWCLLLLLSWKKLGGVNEHAYFYLLCWVAGACVALAKVSRFSFAIIKAQGVWLAPLAVVVIAAFTNPDLLLSSATVDPAVDYLFQFAMCIMGLGLLFGPLHAGPAMFRKAMMRVGEFSYTLYIIHFPLFLFLLSVTQGVVQQSLPLSLAAAVLAVGVVMLGSWWVGRSLERKEEVSPLIERAFSWILAEAHAGLDEIRKKRA